jgi:uncharacterized protein YdeI (YjbR/CyaY-like superfamily)
MAFGAGLRRMSETQDRSAARFFETSDEFRAWLAANHGTAGELWLGIRKKRSGLPSVTYKEAVDAALCFGWIDGVMNGIDHTSYRQRFTPRRKGSIWSAVNIARVEELTRLGLMHPAGLATFETRDPAKAKLYSFEQGDLKLDAPQEELFRTNERAWAFFESQPVSYRKPAIWWVISAKKDETRQRRLATLIADSEAGRRLAHLVSPAKRKTG